MHADGSEAISVEHVDIGLREEEVLIAVAAEEALRETSDLVIDNLSRKDERSPGVVQLMDHVLLIDDVGVPKPTAPGYGQGRGFEVRIPALARKIRILPIVGIVEPAPPITVGDGPVDIIDRVQGKDMVLEDIDDSRP